MQDKLDFIKTPYTTRPNMQRWAGAMYNRNPNPLYLNAKKRELELLGDQLWAITHESTINQLVQKASIHCELEKTDNIVELALQIEEDIAIMHNGLLSAICFCFPSSWVPADRIGQSLTNIHKSVADGDMLVKASDRLTSTMADAGQSSFRRWVWTITTSPELSNHPSRKSNIVPKSLDDLYFRVETQTTEPLGDNVSSLFFVKVDVCPLKDVWAENADSILESINSMTDSILTYKNLQTIKQILNSCE